MNILTVILNRVYYILTKVKNQNPFFGAVIIVSLLLNIFIDSLITFIYLLNGTSNKNEILYYFTWVINTILVFSYARKSKSEIKKLEPSKKMNFVVLGFFLLTIFAFIWCTNINREKISKEKIDTIIKPQKESLEGKIRKLFE